MIKNSIIPEKIGTYYIIPTTIIGIDLGKTHVNATKIYARGNTITIQDCARIQLAPGTVTDYPERAATAIKNTIDQLGSYDQVYTALSSSLVIFKELTLPFLKHGKIELVVGFEVEPLLPFALDDAVIDFIITKQSPDQNSSHVLVAAVQKQHIAQHLALFQQAGIDPTSITIDLFALYSLFLRMPNRPKTESVILIDIGSYTTHLAYIHHDQLRFIRSLPSGIVEQAKKIGDKLDISNGQSMEYLIRFGLIPEDSSEQQYTATAREIFTQFLHTLGFTLQSFSSLLDGTAQSASILLLGEGNQIKGLPTLTEQTLSIPTALFDPHDVASIPGITFSHKNSCDTLITISLATALPSAMTALFNLRKKEFERTSDRTLLTHQLYIAGGLTLFLICAVLIHTIAQTRKLSASLENAKQEVASLVEKRFGIASQGEDLDELVQAAQRSLQEEEKLWFSLANPARLSFLHYLLEFTNRIDKEGLGFVITSLRIADDTITLQARVRDYAALTFLEKELRQSPLFSYVEGQDKPEFNMKIRLAKNPRRKK